jgi:hypothetical protein
MLVVIPVINDANQCCSECPPSNNAADINTKRLTVGTKTVRSICFAFKIINLHLKTRPQPTCPRGKLLIRPGAIGKKLTNNYGFINVVKWHLVI